MENISQVLIYHCSKKKIKNKNSAILVLAWNFFDEIKKNNTNLSNSFINIKSSRKKNEINYRTSTRDQRSTISRK